MSELVDQLFGAGKRGGGCSGQQGDPGTGCGAGESGLKAEQGQTARGGYLLLACSITDSAPFTVLHDRASRAHPNM
jgi:hypothetical protein